MAEPSVWGFNREDAGVLLKVAGTERFKPDNEVVPPYVPPAPAPVVQYLGRVNGTISAMTTVGSDLTPGSGYVVIYRVDIHSGKIVKHEYEGVERTEKVYSFVAEPSGENALVWIGRDAFGTLWYLNEACESE